MDIPDSFHFSHQRRVEFSDTDMAGIVHFANYLRYVESAEHALWRHLGGSVHTSSDEGQHGWPRLNISCSYFKPSRFEDVLDIRLNIEEVKNTTIRYRFYVFNGEPEQLVASGEVTIIHVELDSNSGRMQKAPVPDALRSKLAEL
ncbi:MAG: thioesterase family protein [Opitutales bacterium]|jgi:acyl-CoA thioester hydrolase|nr:acyl-CoA thioesterase [Opitutales bacterium]MDG2166415.1 thioesterase family protein [Opitutales bacterium]